MGGVGQRIKELRKASQMTQQELAEGVVTRSYISQIEKGLIQPSYDTLDKLSKKLDCTVEDFFKEPENTALRVAEWKKYIRFAEGQAESGQYDQARRTLDSCNLDAKGELELNDHDLGLLYWVRGKLAEVRFQHDEARALYEISLHHLASYMYVKERVRTMDSLAYVHLQENRDMEALRILNDANEILLQNQLGGLLKISVLVNSGVAHGKLRECHSAIRLLGEAARINQDLGSHYKAGHIASSLGICHMQLEQFAEAEAQFQRALHFYDLEDNVPNRAAVLNNLGELYRHTERYDESISVLSESFDLFVAQGQTQHAITVRLELAKSFYLKQDSTRARVYCEQVLHDTDRPQHQGAAHKIIGLLDFRSGNYVQALKHFKQAQDLLLPYDVKESFAILSYIAEAHLALGDYETAAKSYQKVARNERPLTLV